MRKMALGVCAALLAGTLLLATACGSLGQQGGAATPAGAQAAGAGQRDGGQGGGGTGISVTGIGRVEIKPDSALLVLGVEKTAATAREAQQQGAAAMDAVMAALKAAGVAEEDIRTASFGLYPRYEYDGKEQRQTGYTLSHMVSVKVRDVGKVGVILDGVSEAGANRIDSVSFTVLDPSVAEKQARELAVADAKGRAAALAKLAGANVGRLISITESGVMPAPVPLPAMAFGKGGEQMALTSVSPGLLEVVVTVYATWAVE